MNDRPDFLPPKPRIIDLTTPAGIRAAIPAFASAVTRGSLQPSEAFATLMLAWLRGCTVPPSARAIKAAEERLDARLLAAYAVCEAIDLSEARAAAVAELEEAA